MNNLYKKMKEEYNKLDRSPWGEPTTWYLTWKHYHDSTNASPEETTYLEFPSDWSNEIIKDEIGRMWSSRYGHLTSFAWDFREVERPPDDWLEEQIEKQIDRISKSWNKMQYYNELKGEELL